ncbi:MAG: PKD domain-containing protein, partial [Actinomycetia bacterium]|nr:PKD domain-containing protein [Actinomycetes bacterium]
MRETSVFQRVVGRRLVGWLLPVVLVAAVLVAVPARAVPAGAAVPLSEYNLTVLDDGPVGYWTFDEGSGSVAHDEVVGRNGTVVGASWSLPGPAGSTSALSFDGVNDYVWLGNSPVLAPDHWSLEVWTRLDEAPVTRGENATLARSRYYGYWLDVLPDGRVTASYFPKSPCHGNLKTITTDPSVTVIDGEWHHVVATKDATDFVIFVDGVEVARGAGASGTCYVGRRLAFGRDGNFNGGYYKGEMDEWAIYDHALTPEQIVEHWCVGGGLEGCTEPLTVDAGADQTVTEGDLVTLAGLTTGGDVAGGVGQVDVVWSVTSSSGPPVQLLGSDTLTPTLRAVDDGSYTFAITASSGDQTVSDEVTVTVANAAPLVGAGAAPTSDDGLVMVSASVTDAGVLDTHSGVVDWGDGTTSTVPSAAGQGAGWAVVSAAHVYGAPGTYQVTVTVSDDDGASTATTTEVEVGGAGVPVPVPGVALWGDASSGRSVWLTGTSHTVVGTVHSNAELRTNGNGHEVMGSSEYVTKLKGNGATFDPAPTQTGVAARPVTFAIGDYQPGGGAAAAAGAQFFDMSDQCGNKWKPSGPLDAGLYWVPCDVQITGTGFSSGPVTIASSGQISVSGGAKDLLAPFVDGLLFISSDNNSRAVTISGSGSTFAGYIYADPGGVDVTGQGHSLECGILAEEIKVAGGGHLFDSGRCGLVDPAGSLTDGTEVTAPPLLVPTLTLEAIPDPAGVLPAQDSTVTATVTNDGATIVIGGLVALANGSFTAGTVDQVVYELDLFDVALNDWVTIASTA